MRKGRLPRHQRRQIRAIAVGVFALAFLIRALWALYVQRPIDGVYSDMGGYVHRAHMLLAGQVGGEPRLLALWPWGTHTIVAGELAIFGDKSVIGIGLCHAFVSALSAPAAAFLTTRFLRGSLPPLLVGLAVAVWHPHISYVGFFSSEVWFGTAMLLATVCVVRYSERPRGSRFDALAAGLLLALMFAVRPQVVLTTGLVIGVVVLGAMMGRRVLPRSWTGAALLLMPLVLTMAGSAIRYQRLVGRPGLIAAYEPIQRVFADTDVVKIESNWTSKSGERCNFAFKSVAKDFNGRITPGTIESFEGFIADPEILGAIRSRRLKGVSTGRRILRVLDNVSLLFIKNRPWPDSDIRTKPRKILSIGYVNASLVVLGFAFVGIFGLGRHRSAAILILVNLVTVLFVGAIYIGEARYRVPYDPLLIIVAVVGLVRVATWVDHRFVRRRGTVVP